MAGLALVGLAVLGGAGGVGQAAPAAQVGTPTATPATVSVNGHGSVLVPPDTASVTLGVDVTKPTLAEAQDEATKQATAIIDAVKAAGVAQRDIQTANYSVNVLRNYDNNGVPGEIQGYQVSNQVNVTIRDVAQVGDILDAVVAAGANNIYGISFYVDDPTTAASQARTAAVADARRKAEELAKAAGLTLGRVVAISETSAPTQPPQPLARGGAMAEAAAVPIEAGTSEITVDVQMTFELEGGPSS